MQPQSPVSPNISELLSLQHPHAQFTVRDAVELALEASQEDQKPRPRTLRQVRDTIQVKCDALPHIWLKGMAALDVLDAAIDGRDLAESSRLRG